MTFSVSVTRIKVISGWGLGRHTLSRPHCIEGTALLSAFISAYTSFGELRLFSRSFSPTIHSGNYLTFSVSVTRIKVLFVRGLGRGFSQKSRLPNVPLVPLVPSQIDQGEQALGGVVAQVAEHAGGVAVEGGVVDEAEGGCGQVDQCGFVRLGSQMSHAQEAQ